MLRVGIAVVLLAALCGPAGASGVVEQDAAAVASARRRRLDDIASCVGTGGAGCLDLQASTPAPLPTDQLTLVAAEMAELAYPGEQGAVYRTFSTLGGNEQKRGGVRS